MFRGKRKETVQFQAQVNSEAPVTQVVSVSHPVGAVPSSSSLTSTPCPSSDKDGPLPFQAYIPTRLSKSLSQLFLQESHIAVSLAHLASQCLSPNKSSWLWSSTIESWRVGVHLTLTEWRKKNESCFLKKWVLDRQKWGSRDRIIIVETITNIQTCFSFLPQTLHTPSSGKKVVGFSSYLSWLLFSSDCIHQAVDCHLLHLPLHLSSKAAMAISVSVLPPWLISSVSHQGVFGMFFTLLQGRTP